MSLALLVALVAAVAMWMRSRSRPIQVDDPPEWPPLPPLGGGDAVAATDQVWRAGDGDGACPDGFPIKAKDSSGIFHVPGGRFYDRTKPDRCYPDAASATADGYRRSKT